MTRLLAIITLLALAGCGTLNEPGVKDRLFNLIDYSSPDDLGPAYYADEHYAGDNPAREIHEQLRAR